VLDQLFKGLNESMQTVFLSKILKGSLPMSKACNEIKSYKRFLSFCSTLLTTLNMTTLEELTATYGPDTTTSWLRNTLMPMLESSWTKKKPINVEVLRHLEHRKKVFKQVSEMRMVAKQQKTVHATTFPSLVSIKIPCQYEAERKDHGKNKTTIRHHYKTKDYTVFWRYDPSMDITAPFTAANMDWFQSNTVHQTSSTAEMMKQGFLPISLFCWNYPFGRFKDVVWDQHVPSDDQIKVYMRNCAGTICSICVEISLHSTSSMKCFCVSTHHTAILHLRLPRTAGRC
jgi:hypothetical protein